jgi:hypothetical protein
MIMRHKGTKKNSSVLRLVLVGPPKRLPALWPSGVAEGPAIEAPLSRSIEQRERPPGGPELV